MALIITGKQIDKEEEYKKLKKRMENMDVVRYTLSIPIHVHEKVRHKLLSEKRNMKELIIEALLKYIDDGSSDA